MTRGPDHGVRLSRGQRMETELGATFFPSEAMITEIPLGTLTVKLSWSSPLRSSSHRSDPRGSGTSDSLPSTTLPVSATLSTL